ncbi:MAG TPA: pitrilysin family protein [candidate division Zixibacteria bacterium]|nr:pitrilysin family protein [candidate division Zixibacteria bacterium]
MNKKSFVLILSLLFAAILVGQAGAVDVDAMKFPKLNKVNIPDIEKITLDNGLRLYLLDDPSLPLFHVAVRMNLGSYLEPAEKVGLAEMCGSLIRSGGTSKWTGDEIDQMLEDVGGMVETSIDVTSGQARVNMLSDYSDMGLEVLADVLLHPVFAEDKIDLARVQATSAISRRNDDIMTLTRHEWIKLVYGPASPYARQPEYATINAITREDLVNYHDQWFHPENMQIAIWGDIDRDEIIAKVKELFGNWQRGDITVPSLPPVDFKAKPGVYYAPKLDAAQSTVRMGHLGGLYTDPDYAQTLVINSILNGTFGSRITDNVRTRLGLAYSAAGNIITNYTYPGYFFCYASTKPQSTVQAAREMIKQIRSMQTDPPTDKEMRKGKDGYLNSFVFKFDRKDEVIQRLMTYDFYGISDDFLDKEKQGVENATAESVLEASKTFLKPEDMVILIVGKGTEFDEPLENLDYGPVDTVDITIPAPVDNSELAITPENIEVGTGLLNEAVAAAGGVEAFKNIENMTIKGKLVFHMGPQSMPGTVEEITLLPDKSKSVVHLGPYEIVSIRDGAVGWKKNPPAGAVEDFTEDDIKDSDEELLRTTSVIFAHLDQPYYRAVYEADEDIDGEPIQWIALVGDDDNVICRLGLDTDKNVRCVKYWGQTMTGEGMLLRKIETFGTVNGMTFPIKSVTSQAGQVIQEVEITERLINTDIPAGTFAKPE